MFKQISSIYVYILPLFKRIPDKIILTIILIFIYSLYFYISVVDWQLLLINATVSSAHSIW